MSHWWFIVLLFVLGGVAIALVSFSLKSSSCKRKPRTAWPEVCEVWNRWLKIKSDRMATGARQFGDGWQNHICPKGKYFQRFNRLDEACVTSTDQATVSLCQSQISNDDVAMPIPAKVSSQDDPRSAVDHWLALKEDMQITQGKRKGDAWEENSVCPSGALIQHIEDETWCVLPENVDEANSEAIKSS